MDQRRTYGREIRPAPTEALIQRPLLGFRNETSFSQEGHTHPPEILQIEELHRASFRKGRDVASMKACEELPILFNGLAWPGRAVLRKGRPVHSAHAEMGEIPPTHIETENPWYRHFSQLAEDEGLASQLVQWGAWPRHLQNYLFIYFVGDVA